MDQYFDNENIISANERCEIYMNDIMEERFEGSPNVYTKTSRNLEGQNEQKIIHNNIKKLHVQRKFWKQHGKKSLFWFYYCVNDNTYVDLKSPWIMCYTFYHNNPINAMNPRTQARRRLISYFKTNGT
jgi:hypothetical protein